MLNVYFLWKGSKSGIFHLGRSAETVIKKVEVSIGFGLVKNSTFLSVVRFFGQNRVRISLKSQSEFGILFGILG